MSRVLPGHSIPYQFTREEANAWIKSHDTWTDASGRKTVQEYLSETLYGQTDTPYGIIVQDPYGQILVWVDATKQIHVVDVTNLSVAREIAKGPYISADEGLIHNFLGELQKDVQALGSVLMVAGAAYLAWELLKR